MVESILLIDGMSMTGFYVNDLKASSVLAASGAKLHILDYDDGAGKAKIIEELDSGRHRATIVCDLSVQQSEFKLFLGTAVKRFADNGGRVAFPTTEGLLLLPVLKALFSVPWKEGSYYRSTWAARPSAAAAVDAAFPIKRFLPDHKMASEISFSAKACSYLNVPAADRCFGVTADSEHESLSMMLAGERKPALGEPSEAEPEGPSEESNVSVAKRRFGTGEICFFGDVNCESTTKELVMAFCLAGGSSQT